MTSLEVQHRVVQARSHAGWRNVSSMEVGHMIVQHWKQQQPVQGMCQGLI